MSQKEKKEFKLSKATPKQKKDLEKYIRFQARALNSNSYCYDIERHIKSYDIDEENIKKEEEFLSGLPNTKEEVMFKRFWNKISKDELTKLLKEKNCKKVND